MEGGEDPLPPPPGVVSPTAMARLVKALPLPLPLLALGDTRPPTFLGDVRPLPPPPLPPPPPPLELEGS